jgi:phage gp29-like protein
MIGCSERKKNVPWRHAGSGKQKNERRNASKRKENEKNAERLWKLRFVVHAHHIVHGGVNGPLIGRTR